MLRNKSFGVVLPVSPEPLRHPNERRGERCVEMLTPLITDITESVSAFIITPLRLSSQALSLCGSHRGPIPPNDTPALKWAIKTVNCFLTLPNVILFPAERGVFQVMKGPDLLTAAVPASTIWNWATLGSLSSRLCNSYRFYCLSLSYYVMLLCLHFT